MSADPTSGVMEFSVASAAETQAIAARLGSVLERGDVVVLTGGLGAGKTTFTQGLGAGLGVRPGIISPTFVLVRIHPNLENGPRPGGPDLVHADAYRLQSAAEIDDIDLENTLDSAVTVVEWGAGRVEHLAESRLEIELTRSLGTGTAPDRVAEEADAQSTDDPEGQDAADADAEPRLLRIRPVGPRWAGVELRRLLLE